MIMTMYDTIISSCLDASPRCVETVRIRWCHSRKLGTTNPTFRWLMDDGKSSKHIIYNNKCLMYGNRTAAVPGVSRACRNVTAGNSRGAPGIINDNNALALLRALLRLLKRYLRANPKHF